MSGTQHAFDFLAAASGSALPAVCVVFGDDAFLKRLALGRLRERIVRDDDDSPPPTQFAGENAPWRDVHDALATRSLFGGEARRLVQIDEADKWVSAQRERLEDYVQSPLESGILLIDVNAWPSNTRLYKAIDKTGLAVDCRLPKGGGRKESVDVARVAKWMGGWAASQHQVKLTSGAADLLLELAANRLGIVDQQLAKLALLVKPGEAITPELVHDAIGGWKAKNMWELLDAAVDGNSADALRHLGKLLDAGEKPIALLGQLSWALRRFHAATRIFQRTERRKQQVDLPAVLLQAGFKEWPRGALDNAKRQLLQLGRQRAGRLYRQLLELDLAFKGSHSNDARGRQLLELFFLGLDAQADPRKARK